MKRKAGKHTRSVELSSNIIVFTPSLELMVYLSEVVISLPFMFTHTEGENDDW